MSEAPTTDLVGHLPPGPYIVTGDNSYANQIGIGRETGPNGYVDPIGVAYGAGTEAQAIAALFAAAPDLLASLRELVEWQAEIGHAIPSTYRERAKRAIAKAEGRL